MSIFAKRKIQCKKIWKNCNVPDLAESGTEGFICRSIKNGLQIFIVNCGCLQIRHNGPLIML